MKTVNFETTLGTVPVTGTAEDFASRKPAVLAITGAFATSDYLSRLPEVVAPYSAGFVVHLPGNHCPRLSETSVAAFARAFDEVAVQLQRPVVAFGVSVGALVALAMQSPVGILAVEPPLSTGKLWPMGPGLQKVVEEHPEFMDAVFGFSLVGGLSRDYRPLIDHLRVPATVVVGSEPLFPKRPVSRYPSFVDEADREYIEASGRASLHVAPGAGHDVPLQASAFLIPHLLALCELALSR